MAGLDRIRDSGVSAIMVKITEDNSGELSPNFAHASGYLPGTLYEAGLECFETASLDKGIDFVVICERLGDFTRFLPAERINEISSMGVEDRRAFYIASTLYSLKLLFNQYRKKHGAVIAEHLHQFIERELVNQQREDQLPLHNALLHTYPDFEILRRFLEGDSTTPVDVAQAAYALGRDGYDNVLGRPPLQRDQLDQEVVQIYDALELAHLRDRQFSSLLRLLALSRIASRSDIPLAKQIELVKQLTSLSTSVTQHDLLLNGFDLQQRVELYNNLLRAEFPDGFHFTDRRGMQRIVRRLNRLSQNRTECFPDCAFIGLEPLLQQLDENRDFELLPPFGSYLEQQTLLLLNRFRSMPNDALIHLISHYVASSQPHRQLRDAKTLFQSMPLISVKVPENFPGTGEDLITHYLNAASQLLDREGNIYGLLDSSLKLLLQLEGNSIYDDSKPLDSFGQSQLISALDRVRISLQRPQISKFLPRNSTSRITDLFRDSRSFPNAPWTDIDGGRELDSATLIDNLDALSKLLSSGYAVPLPGYNNLDKADRYNLLVSRSISSLVSLLTYLGVDQTLINMIRQRTSNSN